MLNVLFGLPSGLRGRFGFGPITDLHEQAGRVYRLQEKFEIMPVGAGGIQQVGGGSLAGKQQHFAVGAALP